MPEDSWPSEIPSLAAHGSRRPPDHQLKIIRPCAQTPSRYAARLLLWRKRSRNEPDPSLCLRWRRHRWGARRVSERWRHRGDCCQEGANDYVPPPCF